jgi:putative transposase
MSRRNHSFAVDEYYHCYNRGTDKRIIFNDAQDYSYFIRSIEAYNSRNTLGKLRLHNKAVTEQQIVEVIAYNLLQNHFHIVLKEQTEFGISKFMQRIGIGYTMYFNEKYERTGALFQGAFKSKYIESDQDLRQVISYVTHNNVVHSLKDPSLYRSYLNDNSVIVRDPNSNFLQVGNMLEVANIIKAQRYSFDE